MSRQLRILFPGAWYHVMNRGANHQPLFYTDYHRKIFITLLRQISIIYKIEIHAYCLMDNHYHLLVRTPLPNLPDAMRHLDSNYAARLNKNLSRDGPLFRGRYKAILVEADAYLLHVSRYIHSNPMTAGMVKELEQYPWSSYRSYIGYDPIPNWLHTGFVWGYFTGTDINEQYKQYTDAGNSEEIEVFYSAEKIKPVLASKKFIDDLKISTAISIEITRINRDERRLSLSEILDVVSKVTGKTHVQILESKRGMTNINRCLFVYLCRIKGGHKLNDIAAILLNCHYSQVSRTLSYFKKNFLRNEHIKSLIAACVMEMRAIEVNKKDTNVV